MRAAATALLLGTLAAGLWLGTPASLHADDTKKRIAALDPKYQEWLAEVDLLIGKEERKEFLALDKDYQRDGFIHRFWEARNPVPGSTRNPFKAQWEARLDAMRAEYGNIVEDRARMRLLHGEPGDILKTDCGMAMWPLEIWHYPGGERLPRNLYLVFYSWACPGSVDSRWVGCSSSLGLRAKPSAPSVKRVARQRLGSISGRLAPALELGRAEIAER